MCSRKTLVYDIVHYSSVLKCNDGMITLTLSDTEISNGETLKIKRACYLNRRASKIVDVSFAVRSGSACLMYRAHIGALFTDLFMNKKIIFTGSDISTLES